MTAEDQFHLVGVAAEQLSVAKDRVVTGMVRLGVALITLHQQNVPHYIK